MIQMHSINRYSRKIIVCISTHFSSSFFVHGKIYPVNAWGPAHFSPCRVTHCSQLGRTRNNEERRLFFRVFVTLPETNVFASEHRPGPKRKFILQQWIFRGYVSFRECNITLQIQLEFDLFVSSIGIPVWACNLLKTTLPSWTWESWFWVTSKSWWCVWPVIIISIPWFRCFFRKILGSTSIASQITIWVFPKIWENPQIIHLFIGFSTINHPFWGNPPIFGNTHLRSWPYLWLIFCQKSIPHLTTWGLLEGTAVHVFVK